MAKHNIFISMGSPFTEAQAKFLDALMDMLRACDVEPRVINKTDYSTGNPLADISRVIRECQGAIIVAYERTFFDSGVEKRKSLLEKSITGVRYTTPWNQIEASMAFALGLPILVLMENGLREEGLLEEKYDWYIERLEVSSAAFLDNNIRARLMAWCRRVQTQKRRRNTSGQISAEMTISELVQMLTLKTAAALLTIAFGVFVLGLLLGRGPFGTFLLGLFGR
jgi:hypothetical protein